MQIEYKIDQGKKVRVISAPKATLEKRVYKSKETKENDPPSSRRDMSPHMHHHEHIDKKQKEMERKKKQIEEQRRKGPVKAGSRPKWNYKNSELKKATKQSEKDPFYVQKKRESDYRRLKREQKLLAMVEANKAVIPDYNVGPPRSRTQSPHSDYGGETPREVRLSRRSKSHSPKRPKIDSKLDYLSVHTDDVYSPYERTKLKSPQQEKSESRTDRNVADSRQSRPRNRSPPIPAIKHRYEAQNEGTNVPVERQRKGVSSYNDIDPLSVPVQNGEFVPFTRTIDVLDPAKADEPVPLSREATRIQNARKVYQGGLQPDKYGNRQHVFQDKQRLKQPEDDSKVSLAEQNISLDKVPFSAKLYCYFSSLINVLSGYK